MKKHWKITTAILTTTTLITGGVFSMLTYSADYENNNQIIQSNISSDLEAIDPRIASLGDVELISHNNGKANFAIIRDNVNGDRVYGWGYNEFGILGVGDIENKTVPTPVLGLPKNAQVKWIKGGLYFTLIVLSDNTVWGTGVNDYGQFGNGKIDFGIISKFVHVQTFPDEIIGFDAGFYHAAALTRSASSETIVYTWGRNNYGQLGTGDKNDSSARIRVSLPADTYTQVKVSGYSSFAGSIGYGNKLCGWGANFNYQLGIVDRVDKLSATIIPLPASDTPYTNDKKWINFYPGVNRVYFVTQNQSNKLYDLYVAGYSNYGNMGDGSVASIKPLTKITGSGFTTFNEIFVYDWVTLFWTTTGDVYSCGLATYSGQGVNCFTPTKMALPKVTRIGGAGTINGASNVFVVYDNEIYAWGDNKYGGYGEGQNTNTYDKPTLVDPFSTILSSVAQIKQDPAKLVSVAAQEIYNAGTFNESAFKNYAGYTGFPAGTVFTMPTAPVIDYAKGEIKCSVTASKSFLSPDGAKSVTPPAFAITLKGFKVLPESAITNKTLTSNTEYNLNNIVKRMQMSGTNNVNMTTFNDLFSISNFPADNKFTIIKSQVVGNQYTATLNASKAQVKGTTVSNHEFSVTFDGLVFRPDSFVSLKGLIPFKYNLTNITKLINPSGDTTNPNALNDLFDLNNFPTGNLFTIDKAMIVDSVYSATLIATRSYVGGDIVSGITYDVSISGLVEQPDSSIFNKPEISNKYNLTNITKLMNPVGDTTNSDVLNELFDFNYFPAAVTFTIDSANITDNIYSAVLIATQAYVEGNILTGINFDVSITGLVERPDSKVLVLTQDVNELSMISEKLIADEPVDIEIMGRLIDLSEFPVDTQFKINSKPIINGLELIFSFTPDRVYKDGNIIANTGVSAQQFDANVLFPPLPVPPGPNWYLIIGLSVGFGLLILIILWILLVARKQRHGDVNQTSNYAGIQKAAFDGQIVTRSNKRFFVNPFIKQVRDDSTTYYDKLAKQAHLDGGFKQRFKSLFVNHNNSEDTSRTTEGKFTPGIQDVRITQRNVFSGMNGWTGLNSRINDDLRAPKDQRFYNIDVNSNVETHRKSKSHKQHSKSQLTSFDEYGRPVLNIVDDGAIIRVRKNKATKNFKRIQRYKDAEYINHSTQNFTAPMDPSNIYQYNPYADPNQLKQIRKTSGLSGFIKRKRFNRDVDYKGLIKGSYYDANGNLVIPPDNDFQH